MTLYVIQYSVEVNVYMYMASYPGSKESMVYTGSACVHFWGIWISVSGALNS